MSPEDDHAAFEMTPVSKSLWDEIPQFRRVSGPANGVVITATVALFLNCGGNLAVLGLSSRRPDAAPNEPMSPAAERGRNAAPFMETCLIGIPTLIIYPLAIAGGIRMKQLRAYPLALASSILVMLPCSCAFIAGLPIGLWAISVLNNPDIKKAFR